MKFLVADDDPFARSLIAKILSASGTDVLVVSDGEEAWRILNAPNPPRLAILDWMMPKLSGLELCRKVRAANWPQYTYMILLSVRTSRVDMLAALDSGIDDYLTKPFIPDELLARIHIGQRVLQKEDRLSHITQEWRTMLDGLPFGVACLRPSGELERANRMFFELLGYENLKEVLNRSLEHILLPGQFDIQKLLESIRRCGLVDRVEVELRTRDGCSRDVLLWGRLIEMPSGPMFEIVTYPR
jgi:DNA-binding response OmpR family regulator